MQRGTEIAVLFGPQRYLHRCGECNAACIEGIEVRHHRLLIDGWQGAPIAQIVAFPVCAIKWRVLRGIFHHQTPAALLVIAQCRTAQVLPAPARTYEMATGQEEIMRFHACSSNACSVRSIPPAN